jgi:hypothetical protein
MAWWYGSTEAEGREIESLAGDRGRSRASREIESLAGDRGRSATDEPGDESRSVVPGAPKLRCVPSGSVVPGTWKWTEPLAEPLCALDTALEPGRGALACVLGCMGGAGAIMEARAAFAPPRERLGAAVLSAPPLPVLPVPGPSTPSSPSTERVCSFSRRDSLALSSPITYASRAALSSTLAAPAPVPAPVPAPAPAPGTAPTPGSVAL